MIELDDVFVVYRGFEHDVAALRGLTLSVRPGERVVVRGPSGSGKSTLVKVVTGELRPSAGRAVVAGTDLTRATEAGAHQWRSSALGSVTQSDGARLLGELTCRENVDLQARIAGHSPSSARQRSAELLERLGVGHAAERYPGSLSGGERQRVALAAALCLTPALVVADEPTGELDAVNAAEVYRLLEEYSRDHGSTILLVSHDLAAEAIADRVLTIRDGRLGEERRDHQRTTHLVVDGRGWVRLPEAARLAVGLGRTTLLTVDPDRRAIRLLPDSDDPGTGAEPAQGAPSEDSPPPPSRPSPAPLSARGVGYRIDQQELLQPVDLELSTPLTAITGRSGSGKTTLLSILAGLIQPTTGIVERREVGLIALVPRAPGFDESASARDNVMLSRALRGLHGEGPLRDTAEALGLTSLLDRAVITLSGGERQRVGVLRALCSDATLVIADEPTSQLDEANARTLAHHLRAVADAGTTVVVATHDQELIDVATHVLAL